MSFRVTLLLVSRDIVLLCLVFYFVVFVVIVFLFVYLRTKEEWKAVLS